MSKFEIYKFIHIAAVVIWVGGGVLGAILAQRAKKADPVHALGIATDMAFVSRRVFAPAAMAALVSGVLMVLDVDGIEFEQAWIAIGFGGIIASMGLAMGFIGPNARRLVAELTAENPKAAVRLRSIALAVRVDLTVMLVVLWAMVTKPGL